MVPISLHVDATVSAALLQRRTRHARTVRGTRTARLARGASAVSTGRDVADGPVADARGIAEAGIDAPTLRTTGPSAIRTVDAHRATIHGNAGAARRSAAAECVEHDRRPLRDIGHEQKEHRAFECDPFVGRGHGLHGHAEGHAHFVARWPSSTGQDPERSDGDKRLRRQLGTRGVVGSGRVERRAAIGSRSADDTRGVRRVSRAGRPPRFERNGFATALPLDRDDDGQRPLTQRSIRDEFRNDLRRLQRASDEGREAQRERIPRRRDECIGASMRAVGCVRPLHTFMLSEVATRRQRTTAHGTIRQRRSTTIGNEAFSRGRLSQRLTPMSLPLLDGMLTAPVRATRAILTR